MKIFALLCTVAILLALMPSPVWAEGESRPQQRSVLVAEGQRFPTFSAVDAFGQRREFTQLKGKRALLVTFFPKCFTGNCSSQLKSLRDSYPALQKAGVEVWAVSTDAADGPKGQRDFSKHLKLPFPLLPDPSRRISLLFGAVQTKEQMAARMSVFIDKNGIVRFIDKQINPRTHGQDVLRLISSLKTTAVNHPNPKTL